ncbi:15-hydroxyprostaglandin dehydrogenase (nad(+)) protein [Diplodia corticola]|uniref:Indoleamine 2,3-dioxygenase n=1 Tax=Diplodia corticola TaxID=236234 RepID=A0A1J9R0C1_9PEZI|nr:15-hydroxyprostaglandin dehydrogenase (nad(+)) protein [Diplodia corticola]OJD34049.1 15-hydroxyprostaglandin dehydrogenase (nad(+)) protein [Diplodia corticola]
MSTNLQKLLLALVSYLKTILFTLLAGITIPSTTTTTTTRTRTTRRSPQHHSPHHPSPAIDTTALLSTISSLAAADHEPAARLHAMIAHDGGGTWPPRFPSDLSAWPAPLRGYHEAYHLWAPHLYSAHPSTSDATNIALRSAFRARLAAALEAHVDVGAVVALLERSETDAAAVRADVFNAFFACVAMTRHAYRWATIPAVRVAQEEKAVGYPAALGVPWGYLQRRYGFGSQAGNALTNFLYHWGGEEVGPVYKVNVGEGVAPAVERAEYWFAFMFAETERLAVPVYVEVVRALGAWERGERAAVLAALREMRERVRDVVKVLYDNLVESKIEREVWLGWVQGFHAYGAGEEVDGAYVESDGVSGNQLPFFQVVDAFLGMGAYLSPEESRTSVSVRQRMFSAEVRKKSFRREAKEMGDDEVEREMAAIAKQVRVWRAAHKVRIVPYLAQPAPERMLMMAGKSVLETKGVKSIKGVVEYLDYLVGGRIEQTK